MTNVSPWIIRTLTLPPLLASLVSRNFRRYHTPTIYSRINSRTYSKKFWPSVGPSSKQPPYLPIMAFPLPFRDILPCYFLVFHLLWHASSLSYCFAWSCSWHCICGKATVHNYFIHVTLDSLYIPEHRQRHSYRVIFCSKYRVVILEL